MKTLNTIQTLSKLGKIFSTIIYVFSVIGAVAGFAAMVCLRFFPEGIKIGGTTIYGLIDASEVISVQDCFALLTIVTIGCIGEAVLCKIAQSYFKNELAAGTPFTLDGAKELLRFGICAVCIPIAMSILSQIVTRVLFPDFVESTGPELASSASVAIGVMLIVMSLLCRHGAEQAQPEALPEAQPEAAEEPAPEMPEETE